MELFIYFYLILSQNSTDGLRLKIWLY